MTALLATRAARRKGITFVILAVVALFLMAISSNPVIIEFQKGITFALSPVQRSLDATAGGVAGLVRAVAEIDRLRLDNATLRDENDRLRAENVRLGETRRENDLLTGLLQLRAGFEYETVTAAVIAREPAEFRRALTLDRGSDDGISEGDVVIAAGGALAGRVVEVGPTFAKVALLTDGSSIVIGQLVSSAATGEVVGQLGGALVMSKIDSGITVQAGDEVVTAGIELGGGIRSPYPKNLLIGQVIDVRRDANDVVQTAYLEPAAPLDRVEYLLVITDYEGGLPPPEEQPIDCGDVDEVGEGTLPGGEQPCLSPPPSAEPGSASPAPGG